MSNQTKSYESYLSFKLGNEIFAASTRKVLSILEVTDITPVPHSPSYMKGIINLRGTVLPIIDTRVKLGLPPTSLTNNTCIIVFEVTLDNEILQLGALVDAVQAVLEVDAEKIQPAPSIGTKYKSEFVQGITSYESEFVMLLDIDQIFGSNASSSDLTKNTEAA